MKNMQGFLLAISLIFSVSGFAQLKVFKIGSVSIGSILAPPAGCNLQITGNSIFTSNQSLITFATDSMWANASLVNQAATKNWAVALNGTETFYVTGNGYAYSNGSLLTSDVSRKENIHTIPGALSKVLKLRGVSFNFMKEPLTEIGVIAQEVEPVVPEVVRTLNNGLKAVAYQNMVGLLIEAIKEQNVRIDGLEAEIAALKGKQ
jgi:hypothetical protein